MRILAIVAMLLWAGTASAETLLRLSESASVTARPDEMAASLRAEAQNPSARVAQNAVNSSMAKAMASAKAAAGITASTGVYQVYQIAQPSPHWQAAQTLDLHGGDGDALLALVGSLQEQGLVVQSLGWRLKADTAKHAREEATAKALGALRARAEAAAAVLGLHFVEFREVRLDGARAPQPMPRMLNAAVAMPVVEAADVDVSASVEADVVLK
jgi:predicted secreted protein